MTIKGNAGEFPTIWGSDSNSVPGLLLGMIPTKTNPEVAIILWFTTSICVYGVTGLMNIQGRVQDFTHNPQRLYKYRQMGRILTQKNQLIQTLHISYLSGSSGQPHY